MFNIRELNTIYDKRKSFYGKAHVLEVENGEILISYETKVAQMIDGVFEVICGVDEISNTTMRHIREFMYQSGFGEDVSLGKQKIIERYMR